MLLMASQAKEDDTAAGHAAHLSLLRHPQLNLTGSECKA